MFKRVTHIIGCESANSFETNVLFLVVYLFRVVTFIYTSQSTCFSSISIFLLLLIQGLRGFLLRWMDGFIF